MTGRFALWQGEVFLRSVNVRGRFFRWRCGCDTSGLGGEETLENTLGLPFCCMCEIHPDIHSAWTTKSWIKALNMVSRSKKESVMRHISGKELEWSYNDPPAFCSGDPIEAVQKSTQAQC